MSKRDFCNWLKGYLDGMGAGEEVSVIRKNLELALNSKDPIQYGYPWPIYYGSGGGTSSGTTYTITGGGGGGAGTSR